MEEPTITSVDDAEDSTPPVRSLTGPQRRVLGVLVEKGFTTPEYYPLTLKAVTTGCNQKSNRDPITHYSEDAVEEALDELRNLGLVAVVHTESGRTERFRHFMRKRYPFTGPQLAIVTELLLRGRQQLGELRSRASRMVAIDSLDELRLELQKLAEGGFIRSSGPLERRGIDVDHAFYDVDERPAPAMPPQASAQTAASSAGSSSTREGGSDSAEITELRQEVDALRSQLAELAESVDHLKRSLGVVG